MRKFIPLIVAGLLTAGAAHAANPSGEEQLERALAGRVAGEPVRCINLHGSSSSTIIDETAILYRVGGTIYVNRPRNGAESLDRDATMVNRLWGSNQLCSIDTVRMVDASTGFFRGVVFLGEFVPYRRVRSRD
jgi:hypothetical protein